MQRNQTHPVPFEVTEEWPRSIEHVRTWIWEDAIDAVEAEQTIRFDLREVTPASVRATFFANHENLPFRVETRINGNYLYVRKVTKK